MRELTFLDIVVMQRIEPESLVERFGSKINSSFFDTANILGGLKLKGYIDILSSPGNSEIKITESGQKILEEAEARSGEEVDALDTAVIEAIAVGMRDVSALTGELNVRSSDLALHIYKLVKKNLIDYEVHSGKVELMLTEEGFNRVSPEKRAAKKEEKVQKEEAVKAARQVEEEAAQVPPQRFKIDKWTRLRAKAEYHSQTIFKYAIVILVLIAVVLIYLLYTSK